MEKSGQIYYEKKTLAQVGRKVPSGIEKRGPTGLKRIETVLKNYLISCLLCFKKTQKPKKNIKPKKKAKKKCTKILFARSPKSPCCIVKGIPKVS